MARFLAFDLGAESGRAILAELSSSRIELRELHRFPTHQGKMQGVLQWNLLALWEDLKTGLRKTEGVRLDGIGVDTWGVDFGLLDPRGKVLCNPVCYRDSRTDGVMDRVAAAVGRERLYAATGIQLMFFNTLFQLVALKEQGGGLPREAVRLLFMPDLLHYLMSGVAANELTIASTGALLDPRTKTWAAGLMDELGLPAAWLGDLVAPGTTLGGLLPEVAAECDVAAGTPVIAPASHDTASAVAAVPASAEDAHWAYLSSGTWSLLGIESDVPTVSFEAQRLNYTNEQGAGGKVRLLKNIMGLWLVQEIRRDLAQRGTALDYPELTRLAAAEQGLELILSSWHPPLARAGNFLEKIDAYATATGQHPPNGGRPGAYVRACLDSLALSYRVTLDELERLTGRSLKTLHIVGGGARNELLNQMAADATGRQVVAGPAEATAVGNALTQALGTGDIGSLADGRRIVAKSFGLKVYEPRDTGRYEKVLPRFREWAAAELR